MFGMKFGGEKKPVAKVETPVTNIETNETIENQIEQETVKLDANFENLKSQIADIGGVDALNEKMKKYANEPGFVKIMTDSITAPVRGIIENPKTVAGATIGGGIGIVTLLGSIEIVLNTLSGNPGSRLELTETILQMITNNPDVVGMSAGAAYTAFAGTATVGNLAFKVQDWWENRKLKSLKNKAEVAGIA